MIGYEPDNAGAVHETDAERSPALATASRGADAGVGAGGGSGAGTPKRTIE